MNIRLCLGREISFKELSLFLSLFDQCCYKINKDLLQRFGEELEFGEMHRDALKERLRRNRNDVLKIKSIHQGSIEITSFLIIIAAHLVAKLIFHSFIKAYEKLEIHRILEKLFEMLLKIPDSILIKIENEINLYLSQLEVIKIMEQEEKEFLSQIKENMKFNREGNKINIDITVNKTKDNMIKIPAAGKSFQMGSNTGEHSDEQPIHTVKFTYDYYLSRYPVTVSQFEKFIKETNYVTEAEKEGWSYIWTDTLEKKSGVTWRSDVKGQKQKNKEHPVINVSWNDAQAYCNWLNSKQSGYRLPTEAEWEYACRAGTTGERYGELDEIGWYRNNSGGKTHPVGQKKPNDFGLYDMLGNVWERCNDWYDAEYYEECKKIGTVLNPTGPNRGTFRVLRGGSWNFNAEYCRSANRIRSLPELRMLDIGFRLARGHMEKEQE
jgi:formylglycine-generating enzyme required for sulfatase activity